MQLAADLHLHSRYARAVSPEMTLPNLLRWAQIKGLDALSTGDCLHGPWLREIEGHLSPGNDGLLHPSSELLTASRQNLPEHLHRSVRFVLGTEVSCGARSTDDPRGIHVLIYLPDFAAVHALRASLTAFSDLDGEKQGRPALLLSPRDVLQRSLAIPGAHFSPAHVFNSFVSLLNAVDGHTRVTDAFGDLTSELLGLEAALTSTPAHCRRLSQLDRHALLANSDAHSLPKLGRECSLFETPTESDFTYDSLFSAINRRKKSPVRLVGTEEYPVTFARYWLNWCSHCQQAHDAPAHGTCPVCRKTKLVLGARDRLAQLADRDAPARHLPFVERLPLLQLLTTLAGRAEPNDEITRLYHALIGNLGAERTILNETEPEAIARASFPALADAIIAQRAGRLDFAALRHRPAPPVPSADQLPLF
jgi:Uncharacterized conserved protein